MFNSSQLQELTKLFQQATGDKSNPLNIARGYIAPTNYAQGSLLNIPEMPGVSAEASSDIESGSQITFIRSSVSGKWYAVAEQTQSYVENESTIFARKTRSQEIETKEKSKTLHYIYKIGYYKPIPIRRNNYDLYSLIGEEFWLGGSDNLFLGYYPLIANENLITLSCTPYSDSETNTNAAGTASASLTLSSDFTISGSSESNSPGTGLNLGISAGVDLPYENRLIFDSSVLWRGGNVYTEFNVNSSISVLREGNGSGGARLSYSTLSVDGGSAGHAGVVNTAGAPLVYTSGSYPTDEFDSPDSIIPLEGYFISNTLSIGNLQIGASSNSGLPTNSSSSTTFSSSATLQANKVTRPILAGFTKTKSGKIYVYIRRWADINTYALDFYEIKVNRRRKYRLSNSNTFIEPEEIILPSDEWRDSALSYEAQTGSVLNLPCDERYARFSNANLLGNSLYSLNDASISTFTENGLSQNLKNLKAIKQTVFFNEEFNSCDTSSTTSYTVQSKKAISEDLTRVEGSEATIYSIDGYIPDLPD